MGSVTPLPTCKNTKNSALIHPGREPLACLEGPEAIAEFVERQRTKGASIGFVPTMGALHAGHLSLVERSARECDCTVVSIFVNPTQFNREEDLQNYPRTLDADLSMLSGSPCDAVFAPHVETVYPNGTQATERWDFGSLSSGMEGQFRPGHFDGVAQVVHRLLQLIQPDVLYLGQKDLQQFAVVQRMVQLSDLPVEVRMCPIVREPDGLAMSSRNLRLSPAGRKVAVSLSTALFNARQRLNERGTRMLQPVELVEGIRRELSDNPDVALEYVEVVHPQDMQPITTWMKGSEAAICLAAWVEGIRLIDNILIPLP